MIFSPALGFKNVYLGRNTYVKLYKIETQWKTNVIVMGAKLKCRIHADAEIRPALSSGLF